MAPPNRIFKEAEERGLVDRPRSPDEEGNERTERRSLHERRRAYGRAIREATPPDHWRQYEDDIAESDLEDKADIKAADRKRAKAMAGKRIRSQRGQKRKRVEDAEEQTPPAPKPIDTMPRPRSSRKAVKTTNPPASSLPVAPPPTADPGPSNNGAGLHIIIMVSSTALTTGTRTAFRLPRDIVFHLLRSITCGDLVTMVEMKMVGGVDQPQGPAALARWARKFAWEVRLASIDQDVEMEVLGDEVVLGEYKDEEDQWPLRLDGKILGRAM